MIDLVMNEYLTRLINYDEVLDVREKAMENHTREVFRKEVGLLFAGPITIEIEFDFREEK